MTAKTNTGLVPSRRELMERASTQTGLDDFGDIPFHEPLDVLIESLNREANLDAALSETVSATIIGSLCKRLQLVNDRKLHPSIADEKIDRPVFIVGLPRTGSTHLHALMEQVEGVRTPLFWEGSIPSPPPEASTATTDPRIATIQAAVDGMSEEMLVRHPMDPMRPEQCNTLTDWSFYNQALLAFYYVPTYRDWLLNADYAPSYVVHRRTLQQLQWHKPGRWVLKYPKHLISLDSLLDEYPDARLIWTHRDPAKVIPSVSSFTGLLRSATPGYDSVRYGREWALIEEIVIRRGLEVRDRLGDSATRDMDVHYEDLMADPVGTVESICAHGDLEFSEASSKNVSKWIDDHPKTKHGVHQYEPEDFGFTVEGLHRRFAFYTERFGVKLSTPTPAATAGKK